MAYNNNYCCVPQCRSWAKRDTDNEISFHTFPKENSERVYFEIQGGRELIDRRKAWIIKVGLGKPLSKHMKVCSLHFKQEDYFNKGEYTKRGRVLKKTAVPSENLVPSVPSKKSVPRGLKHSESREKKTFFETDCDPLEVVEANYTDIQAADSLDVSLNMKKDISEQEVNNIVQNKLQTHDSQVQVNMDKVHSLIDLLKTDSALKTFTGLNNFQMLDCLVEIVKEVCQDTRSHRLNLAERVVLTMTKIKLDLSYDVLGALFNVSSELCETYFHEFLPILSKVLESCIHFPSDEETYNNMPKCFESFQSCRVILDCTEILTEKPSCICCRIKFYSPCKQSTTVKFITGVSPAGLITFISKSYGGQASNQIILEDSNLISKLTTDVDSVMVDESFLIDDICAIHKIELIRPLSSRDKKLTKKEAHINKKIAAARKHIDRSNKRLKGFKIISGELPWSLVPKIDHIFTIICGIINLLPPILTDEKFL